VSGELSVQGRGGTGFYGKMPDQGDFVGRRLAGAFVQAWDAWLQECITHCRAELATHWDRLYRDAPVWRFLLAPGVCGTSAWAGLVQPSVDRVGRYFPLTVAAELPSDVEVLDTMIRAGGWYDAIERIAAAAFDNQITVERLDERLAVTGFPEPAIVSADAADDTLPIAERSVEALQVGCPAGCDLTHARTALREAQISVGHSHCVWFNASPADLERVVLVSRTLPQGARSQALFDGRWDAHGWPGARPDARATS
jgi:type VI secretion system protein ImpM